MLAAPLQLQRTPQQLAGGCRPSVNFISGTNGSGKSATLQALQFCLGVAARHTGRGQGAKDLIKYGARQLLARVTLWNTGPPRCQHPVIPMKPVQPLSKAGEMWRGEEGRGGKRAWQSCISQQHPAPARLSKVQLDRLAAYKATHAHHGCLQAVEVCVTQLQLVAGCTRRVKPTLPLPKTPYLQAFILMCCVMPNALVCLQQA